MDKYLNRQLTAAERAEDLLVRMTLREKVGQLNQRLYGFRIYEVITDEKGDKDIELTQEFRDEVERYGGMGFLYGLLRADPWADRDYDNGLYGELGFRAYNKVQTYVCRHSRFNIPVTMTSECPHGHQALDGDVLPVNLAVGATFDPDLYRKACEINGRRVKDRGVHMALMSMLDILRDPRWGRCEECYSEDPVLAGTMAAAATEGTRAAGVQVVAKHFCAQGEGTGGVNASAARIGDRELREMHLPAARAAVEAGAEGIMAAYNEIDGVPCHANKALLTDILRDEMGFEGIVMSDGVAIDRLNELTHGDNALSGAMALKAGVDVGLWDTAFGHLEEALDRGLISEEDIDRAVRRVLISKFESGLFDNPYLTMDKSDKSEEDIAEAETAFKELAVESFVLVKNEGVLPFRTAEISVTGNNADDFYALLGDYTPPVQKKKQVTVRQAIEKNNNVGEDSRAEALDTHGVVAMPEVCVVVIGGSSSRFGRKQEFDSNGAVINESNKDRYANDEGVIKVTEMDCGEGVDISDISIPEYQIQYLKDAKAEGKDTVAVVIAGRPYALGELEKYADAIIVGFYPGEKGAEALADILFGNVCPGGRLPVSIPRTAGQIPVYYNYRESYAAMSYKDAQPGPLYCFGEGLGYGCVEYSNVRWEQDRVSCTVTNNGGYRDRAVPQVYLHVLKSETVARVRELRTFTSCWLEPGETRELKLEFPREKLLVPGLDPKEKKLPGEYELILSDGREVGRKEFRAY